MWEALLQQHSPQVLGGSPCFAWGRRDVKLLRNPRAGDRRPSRRRIAVAAYQGIGVTSVQALADAAASLQSGAMAARRLGNAWGGMHEAVHSLTGYGGILPVHAEESEKLESEDASFVAEEESVELGESEDAGVVAEEAREAGGSVEGAEGYVGESVEAGESGEGGESGDVGGSGGYAGESVEDSFADSQPASDAGGVAGEAVEAEGSGNGIGAYAGESAEVGECGEGGGGYGGEFVDVGESGEGGGGYGGEPVDVWESGEGGGGYAGKSVDDTVVDSQPATDGTEGGESVTDSVGQPAADGIVGGESVTDGVAQPGADGIVGEESVTDGVAQPGADGIVGGESVTDGVAQPGADGIVGGESVTDGVAQPGADGIVGGESVTDGVAQPGADGIVGGESVTDGVAQPGADGIVGGESVTDGVAQPGADGIVGGESVTDGVAQPGADGIVGGESVTDGVAQPGADGIVGGESVTDGVAQPGADGIVGGDSVTDGVAQPGADGIVGGESVTDGVAQPGADGIVGGESVTDGVAQPGADGIVGGESVTDAGSQGDGFGGGSDALFVEKPRRVELDYNELVRGSGSGGSDQDGGNYDPLGTVNDAISGVQDAVANSVASVQKFFQDAIEGITKPFEDGGVGSDQGADEAAQTGFGVDQSGGEAVVQSSSGFGSGNPVQDAVDSAQNFFEERVRDVEQAVQNVADGVTGSIQNAVSSVTGAADNVRLDIQTSVENTTAATQQKALDTFGVFYPGTSANNALKVVVDGVKDNLGAALVTAEGYVVDVYSSTKGSLPQETQDALSNIEGTISEYSKPVVSSVEQGFEVVLRVVKTVGIDIDNPIVPSIAVGLPVVYIGISWWIQRYGGYSGDLDPRIALELLKKERNVALIDIRSQEVRDADGILDLRRGARFKDGNVEIIKVSSAVRKLVRSPRDIDNVVTAAVILNLKIVNVGLGIIKQPNSKLILLDADGRQTKDLARTLRKLGVQKQYRIEGGFKAWVRAGLPIKGEGPLTPIAILKEETEAIVEEVKPTTGGVALVALGLVAGVYAISQYEKTLQLIGFLAVCQLLYDKLNGYRSVEDVKKDLRFLGLPFVAGFKLVSRVASRIVPPKLQLATTPSTSAVKEKVLQAAAKHGPNAPEVEQPPEGSSRAQEPPSPQPPGEGKSADN